MSECVEAVGAPFEADGYRRGEVQVGPSHVKGERGPRARYQLLAHVAAYMLEHGGVPAGMSVLHRCDNPPCVNPDHLFIGTHLDNMRDREAKGRGANGRPERTHCPKGHEYTPQNTGTASNNGRPCRKCKACVRERSKAWREARA